MKELQKNSVYAVVNVKTGEAVTSTCDREHARAQLQFTKSRSHTPQNFKIAKLKMIEKFVR